MKNVTILAIIFALIWPKRLLSIPFDFIENLVIIEASVDGLYGQFIFDTGIDHPFLNSRYFNGRLCTKMIYGMNGEAKDMEEKFVNLSLRELSWKKVYVGIISIPLIEQKLGVPILGLIGGQCLKSMQVVIDYSQKEIEIKERIPSTSKCTS